MRIALIYALSARGKKDVRVTALAKGMESMGHRVDLLDAWTEDGTRLPGYEYIVVYAEALSFLSSKLAERLPKILSSASSLVGKKSAAFLHKGGLFSGKAMGNLMRAMEKEGMCVNWSDSIASPELAEAIGKRIGA